MEVITNIFDFLTFKNVKRTYGQSEVVSEKLSKMPITLTTNSGKDLLVYLLVSKNSQKDREVYYTLSMSHYAEIKLQEDQVVCDRFDSETPTIYDLNGKRINEDSKLRLKELER